MPGFGRDFRLSNGREFHLVFQARRTIRRRTAHLHSLENTYGHSRLGIVVSKKVSKKAVIRNRVKRIIRESFRLQHPRSSAHDIVVIVKQPMLDAESQSQLKSQLSQLWKTLP